MPHIKRDPLLIGQGSQLVTASSKHAPNPTQDDARLREPKSRSLRQLPSSTFTPRALQPAINLPTTTNRIRLLLRTIMTRQRGRMPSQIHRGHLTRAMRPHLQVGSLSSNQQVCQVSSAHQSTIVEPPATDLLSSFFVNPGADQPPEPSEMVVYCSYSFLTISNMFYVPAQDVRFLDKEDCFRLPARSILDQAIQQYFLHVHPLLPMLSEADFWEAYYSPAPEETKKTSLLLIQAMLFVSCNVSQLYRRLQHCMTDR